MTYRLAFLPSADKEWRKLGATLHAQFKAKIMERLDHLRVEGDALHGLIDHYKVKLWKSGYRLVYRVDDDVLTVVVVAIGKRERAAVYETARRRQPR